MLKLKICGNHQEADLQALLKVSDHLEHIGFIFTPNSKRTATIEQTRAWLRKYPQLAKKAIAVFLNQSVSEMKEILNATGICSVQLHGHESLKEIGELRNQVYTALKIWKVLHVAQEGNSDVLKQLFQDIKSFEAHVDAFLLDTQIKEQLGGTGRTFDWHVLPKLYHLLCTSQWHPKPLWIAGGIKSEHLATIKQIPGVYGVDVASGAETGGVKDVEKIRKLIEGVNSHATIQSVSDS